MLNFYYNDIKIIILLSVPSLAWIFINMHPWTFALFIYAPLLGTVSPQIITNYHLLLLNMELLNSHAATNGRKKDQNRKSNRDKSETGNLLHFWMTNS